MVKYICLIDNLFRQVHFFYHLVKTNLALMLAEATVISAVLRGEYYGFGYEIKNILQMLLITESH